MKAVVLVLKTTAGALWC